MENLVVHGTYFTSQNANKVESHENYLICIDQSGTINRTVAPSDKEYSKLLESARKQERLIYLKPNQYILPGFIDLHVHAPQWPQAGLALDLPLADWLNHYTFPLEAKFSDLDYAHRVYRDFVHELLSQGTTTALMFGTIHNNANLELAQQSIAQGLRAFVGQVVMDNPEQTPDYYRNQSTTTALQDTEKFIQSIFDLRRQTTSTIMPVITPRFVPSCTDEALSGLGQLARQYDLPVQSHLSESNWEHGYAIKRFGIHDTSVMERFHLLTKRSVMAHGTQLTDSDLELLRQRGTSIAHCPISNIYFGNGVLPVKKLLIHGNQVGLGSDISGGYSPSLYHNIRQAVKSSQMLTDGVDSSKPTEKRGVRGSRITMATAFYLATVGGAKALRLKTGEIAPGYQADFQIVNGHRSLMKLSRMDVFQRLMYQTEQQDIHSVYVAGKEVYRRE
ncbi:MAG: guanine deaminase [Limosilactobacillus sp.]|jgi:guanine deaminase|uniref:guanine deaminase n=1 Tax=Limosilactobacillus sp. TaxID=2773925 RepID=UPI0025BB059D|nr:guanine deaminase [Limosilactobacillus sp.]MCI1974622.1 guanine deaminase [Limosilactobacillus sp.]